MSAVARRTYFTEQPQPPPFIHLRASVADALARESAQWCDSLSRVAVTGYIITITIYYLLFTIYYLYYYYYYFSINHINSDIWPAGRRSDLLALMEWPRGWRKRRSPSRRRRDAAPAVSVCLSKHAVALTPIRVPLGIAAIMTSTVHSNATHTHTHVTNHSCITLTTPSRCRMHKADDASSYH